MDREEVGAESAVSSVSMQGGHTSAGATENVDRIREILFGSQMREYGQRFAQLEERLLRETGELKNEVRRRLDSLEAYAKQEIEALSDRLRIERNERTEAAERASREVADATRSLERRVVQSEEQLSKDMREIRQLILERQRSLSDELTQCVSKSEMLQNRRLEELRASATDRIALASLLAEVAMRIRGESLVRGVEDTLSAGAGR
jgi:seryl-tRNA synthetase